MIDFSAPRIVSAGEAALAVYEDGAGPPVILVHGWPEIAYSWKPIIPAIAGAGYRAIALDLKGFGRSDAPSEKYLYDIRTLTGDLAALLDALDIDRAVFCGHDWGGAIVWAMAQLRAERVAGVISLCTPLHPRPPVPPLKIIEKRLTKRHYFVRFQEENVPEKLFETDIERFFRLVFQKPAPRERWAELVPDVYDLLGRFEHGKAPDAKELVLSEKDLEVYINAYRRSGFRGGINIYRNIDRNWALTENCNEIVRAPALWIGADLDLFLPPETAQGMEKLIPDLETHILSGCGHWMSWEKPKEASSLIVDWLKRRYP